MAVPTHRDRRKRLMIFRFLLNDKKRSSKLKLATVSSCRNPCGFTIAVQSVFRLRGGLIACFRLHKLLQPRALCRTHIAHRVPDEQNSAASHSGHGSLFGQRPKFLLKRENLARWGWGQAMCIARKKPVLSCSISCLNNRTHHG